MIRYIPTDYKKLLILPLILLIFCASVLGYTYFKKGYIFEKSIDFEGGTEASVLIGDYKYDIEAIEISAKENYGESTIIRTSESNLGTTINMQSKSEINLKDFEMFINQTGLKPLETDTGIKPINIQTIGASVGKLFFSQAIAGILVAFLFMGLVIFLVFRTYIPSIAIISAAAMDILFAATMMVLVGIELSLGSLAALLMLIGYSVDTDILLTTKLLKRKGEGSLDERINDSMKTGITMTTSAIGAFIALYAMSPSKVLDEISLVIIFGLLADYITTWFQNVGILRWHLKDKENYSEKPKRSKRPSLRKKQADNRRNRKKNKK